MKTPATAFLCCTALVLGACDASTDDNTLNIGIVLPLSGTLAEAGSNIRDGMVLARDEINKSDLMGGTALSFIVHDNRSTPDGSAAAFNTVINDENVPLVLGPLSSSSTTSIVSIADAARIVAFSPTSAAAGISAKSRWIFRASLTIDKLVPHGIQVTKQHLNYTRAATIANDEDTFSMSGNAAFTEVLEADAEVSIVSAIAYSRPPGTAIGDLTAELTQVLNANPQVIFLTGLPEDYVGVITQARALGITDIPFICPLLALSDVQHINAEAPGAAEGIVTLQAWIASSEISLSRTFVDNYTARHGKPPGDFAASGYVTVYIAAHAMARAANYQADAIRNELARTVDLPTIYGTFSFDEHGDAVYNPIVAQVKGNEFAVLK